MTQERLSSSPPPLLRPPRPPLPRHPRPPLPPSSSPLRRGSAARATTPAAGGRRILRSSPRMTAERVVVLASASPPPSSPRPLLRRPRPHLSSVILALEARICGGGDNARSRREADPPVKPEDDGGRGCRPRLHLSSPSSSPTSPTSSAPTSPPVILALEARICGGGDNARSRREADPRVKPEVDARRGCRPPPTRLLLHPRPRPLPPPSSPPPLHRPRRPHLSSVILALEARSARGRQRPGRLVADPQVKPEDDGGGGLPFAAPHPSPRFVTYRNRKKILDTVTLVRYRSVIVEEL